MAKKALTHVKASGVGDMVFFGPEAEFFVFDDVRWSTDSYLGYGLLEFDSIELPSNTSQNLRRRQHGPSPGP